MKNITQKEWEELTANDSNAVILDVRTPGECAEGIIENAKCLNIFDQSAFLKGLESLDASKNYYVYCRSGQRSSNACAVMEKMGFKNTYNLLGGMSKWSGKVV